ncbi:MAG: CPBP family intramembrane metalloprotease [Bacteroidales bacterium]|nr:CPBP family intramembrane metalloprotease [Bacteroidales bacterium]
MSAYTRRNSRAAAPAGGGYGFTGLTYGRRLLLLACVFVLMMVVAGSAGSLASHCFKVGSRDYFIAVSVLQNLIGFCGTAFVCAIFLSTRPLALLGLNRLGTSRALLGIVLAFAVGLPFLNQVVWWNSQMHLPAFLGSLESQMRSWEDAALTTTNVILGGKSVGALVVNVLVVGVFTGFSEELCFRGTMQRVIASGGIGGHAAVWITAVIFSLLHFQFFGFLPRVLLGAFFGYLFLMTGSIYIAATAHALNNSLYVVVHWLELRGYSTGNFEHWGVTTHGFPAVACVSLCLLLCVVVGMRGYLFSTKKV